jgi:hypothetical protein
MYISAKLRTFICEVNGALSTLDEPGKCHGGVKFHHELKLCEFAEGQFEAYAAALAISAHRYGCSLCDNTDEFYEPTARDLCYLEGYLVAQGAIRFPKRVRDASMEQLSFIRTNFPAIITVNTEYTAKMNSAVSAEEKSAVFA